MCGFSVTCAVQIRRLDGVWEEPDKSMADVARNCWYCQGAGLQWVLMAEMEPGRDSRRGKMM